MARDKRLLGAAKMFMLVYLSDGLVRQPVDFDKEILGDEVEVAVMVLLRGHEPAWNKTIFADALGELVEEGTINAWEDEHGWHYQYIVKE